LALARPGDCRRHAELHGTGLPGKSSPGIPRVGEAALSRNPRLMSRLLTFAEMRQLYRVTAARVSGSARFYLAARMVAQSWSNCSFVHFRLAFQPLLHSASVGLMTRSVPCLGVDSGGGAGGVDEGGVGACAAAAHAVRTAAIRPITILLILVPFQAHPMSRRYLVSAPTTVCAAEAPVTCSPE
jgi:hypothetical protein